ncbi:hypothetical protein ACIQUM_07625 [Amycolatopsis azurea]|uniref:hypothetical protein n=1 Tax=Amycolatopsis azurea TaxID=36819 RepID=UPI003823DF5B
MATTSFITDGAVAAVHVAGTVRSDRVVLVAFDHEGALIGRDTIAISQPSHGLDVAIEFDHDFTGMTVAGASDLEKAIAQADGWVIDMRALRGYRPFDDRRETQRSVFLAHLGDMVSSGQARGLLSAQDGGTSTDGQSHAENR